MANSSQVVGFLADKVVGVAWKVYEVVVRQPFRRLWMQGPWMGGYGFWNGRDPLYICSHLSSLSMENFLDRPQQCYDLIEKNFEGFMVACEFVFYVLLLTFFLRTLIKVFLYRYVVANQVQRQIEQGLLTLQQRQLN
jgi:hypothetical protein